MARKTKGRKAQPRMTELTTAARFVDDGEKLEAAQQLIAIGEVGKSAPLSIADDSDEPGAHEIVLVSDDDLEIDPETVVVSDQDDEPFFIEIISHEDHEKFNPRDIQGSPTVDELFPHSARPNPKKGNSREPSWSPDVDDPFPRSRPKKPQTGVSTSSRFPRDAKKPISYADDDDDDLFYGLGTKEKKGGRSGNAQGASSVAQVLSQAKLQDDASDHDVVVVSPEGKILYSYKESPETLPDAKKTRLQSKASTSKRQIGKKM